MSKVLLIEPNLVLAQIYTRALTSAGHAVRHVDSAQGAIHAADESKPDIVILELQLAVHGGIEFLHEFRSYGEWRDIPVLINTYLSPHVLAASQESLARDFGVTVCLYKPQTTLKKLLSAVNRQVVPV